MDIAGKINKSRRHELQMLKFKKRLNQLGLTPKPNANYYAYRSHGAPCSCFLCSGQKYERAAIKRETLKLLVDESGK